MQWSDLCKAYLVEAKWFYSDYRPSLHDYLENAWISSSGPVILVHSYLLLQTTTAKEDLFCFQEYSDLIQFSSIILRLTDDLGSSQVFICYSFLCVKRSLALLKWKLISRCQQNNNNEWDLYGFMYKLFFDTYEGRGVGLTPRHGDA